jgi:hypothetical protein
VIIAATLIASGLRFTRQANDGDKGDTLSWLEPEPAVFVHAAVVVSPEALVTNDTVLTDREVAKLLDPLRGQKCFGQKCLTSHQLQGGLPLVLQWAATGELGNPDPPWNGHAIVRPFVGWVVRLLPGKSASGSDLRVQAAYAFPKGEHPAPGLYMKVHSLADYEVGFNDSVFSGDHNTPLAVPHGEKWRSVIVKTVDENFAIEPEKISCVPLGEVEKGVFATCLIGVRKLVPWEYFRTAEGFPSLMDAPATPHSNNPTVLAGVCQTADYYLTEEIAEKQRIDEMEKRLKDKVESLPVNRQLVEERAKRQAELAASAMQGNAESLRRLRWQISALNARMEKNGSAEFVAERSRLRQSKVDFNRRVEGPLSDKLREMWPRIPKNREELPSPTKFNHNEM